MPLLTCSYLYTCMFVFDLAREGAHMLYLSSEMEYDEVVAPRLPDANIWMGKRLN